LPENTLRGIEDSHKEESMRRSDEMHPVEAPRVRPRTRWELAARKALDTWGPSSEANVAAAIEQGYVDGLKRAAAFIGEKGQQELAVLVQRLVEEESKGKQAG
jgi:hypothetical protein